VSRANSTVGCWPPLALAADSGRITDNPEVIHLPDKRANQISKVILYMSGKTNRALTRLWRMLGAIRFCGVYYTQGFLIQRLWTVKWQYT
jgi:hypothetical protein